MHTFAKQRHGLLLAGALVLFASLGCGRYSHVNWFNPGYAPQQVGRALIEHDPYPDQNAGPEVVGGRPLGFTTPPPETPWLQQRSPKQPLRPVTIMPTQPNYNLPPVYVPPTTNPAPTGPVTTTPNYTLPPYQQNQQPTQQLFPQQPLLPPAN